MGRGPKPAKSKEAKPPVARKSPKDDAARVHDLEKRLAEALQREAEALKREAEALEQQTATAEILQVISGSPTDLQPVFDTIVRSAGRLCDAFDAVIYRRDGDTLHLVAHEGPIPTASMQALIRGWTPGRAVLDGRTVHVADIQAEADEFPEGSEIARRLGNRTVLSMPLMRKDGLAIGAIMVRRTEARLFTDRQVALLRTFADQAVIAIENVRLFTELQARNQEVTQALEQQTATSEVLKVISHSTFDLQRVLQTLVDNATRLCGAESGVIWRFDGEVFRLAADRGVSSELKDSWAQYPFGIGRGSATGRTALEGRTVHIPDVLADPEYTLTDAQKAGEFRTILGVPMLRDGVLVGVFGLQRYEVRPFTDRQVELVTTFADQAAIAIENVRLFTELEEKNKALTQAHAQVSESLEQQTATSEILQVISSSPTDVQPVFDAIVESAARLCEAIFSALCSFDGEQMDILAAHNWSEVAWAAARRTWPASPSRALATGRAIIERAVVHVPDVERDPAYDAPEMSRTVGFRSILAVPMLREGVPVGVIAVGRAEPGPFADSQIALLKTFADQAVIAIENVRLFKELEGANRELSAASQHKSEFLANMSHELRTPLNAIIGFSEVLSEKMFGELNEKQEEYSKDIHASGQHLLSLISDILDLSKIEAGRMELEVTDFHLPTALDNALMLVRERAGRRSITLQTSVDERLGEVRADERKIRQVVLNLLSNAIKFTPEGGRIEVMAALKDGSVEVSVSDTGVGIAPEDQEAVFEEFRQVGTADKKAEGTGLGLTLCRKFVELHGGRVWVKSQVGVGSTFTFAIPTGK